jgi:uncharacterized repeat protein (TIGR02543 family)
VIFGNKFKGIKFFAALFVFSLAACAAFPAASWAADIWDGTTGTGFESGSGTETDPYLIKTGAQLAYLASMVNAGNNYSTYFFKLADDIDLNGGSHYWITIGDGNDWTYSSRQEPQHYFAGNFDGDGRTVSGMRIDLSARDCVGLFGYVRDARISNVTIQGANIRGKDGAGMLVGYSNNAIISNCSANGVARGSKMVGGLAGYIENGSKVSNCIATGSVVGTESVGGLVGRSNSSASSISDSISLVSVTGTDQVGGLVGYIDNSSTISNSVAAGATVGQNEVGGLVGYVYGEVTVSNSSAYGSVEGNSYVGGFVGHNRRGSISNVLSSGRVTGNSRVGGIAGSSGSGATTSASVFDVQGVGLTSGNAAIDKSTRDLTQGAPIPGLGGNWTYAPAGHYPMPTALASNFNTAISQAAALTAVALQMYVGSDLYTTADTSKHVAHPFTVPLTTASGAPIAWSVVPADALTIDSSGNVILNNSGEVALTATASGYSKVFKLKLEPGLFAVTFDSQGGSAVQSVSNLQYGSNLSRPSDPSKDGYVFAGWYEDPLDLSTEWDFDNDAVTANITLYAVWTPVGTMPAYTVTFDSQGGSAVASKTNVAAGSRIAMPATPTREGYVFVGWYENPLDLSTEWDFDNDAVTASITLYAVWTPAGTTPAYTVTFDSQGGSAVASKTNVVAGSRITMPATPTRERYVFAGWYKEPACLTAWNFASDTVTGNITLYAKWTYSYTPPDYDDDDSGWDGGGGGCSTGAFGLFAVALIASSIAVLSKRRN